ncbi:MAG TPA: nutrient deprivation-induced protein, partial [Candidatus Binatia bacterium]|nr:nutrient deprivation-induced protein [Candidatus Binatia bacterium]
IALGAAIGAALPRTEQEDRLLGQASDATISRVKETGSESFNRVKENVKETVSRVGEEAKQAVSETVGRTSEDPDGGARGSVYDRK